MSKSTYTNLNDKVVSLNDVSESVLINVGLLKILTNTLFDTSFKLVSWSFKFFFWVHWKNGGRRGIGIPPLLVHMFEPY